MSLTTQTPFTLPSGTILKNRLAKSAMSETLGTTDNSPTEALTALYRRWAQGGTGLLITGNVMIDRNALGEPNNVVIEDEKDLNRLQAWAQAGRENGSEIWMQLNHPGKQSPRILSSKPVAPSAIPFKAPLNKVFNTPRELKESEILDLINRFARSSAIAKKAGFTGVQIHGAHGYLVSQFLSPLHNQRTDDWGGSLQNRMRFAVEVYQAIRAKVGKQFNVSIKMNSADFQRGGFSEEESLEVASTLAGLGMDLVEISGGTYASPAMTGIKQKNQSASTQAREAYFLEYAEKLRKFIDAPLMITGGFRSSQGIQSALSSGAMDLAGIGRPLAIDPEFSNKILSSMNAVSPVKPITTGIKAIDKMGMMEVAWYTRQIARIAEGKDADNDEGALASLMKIMTTVSYRGLRTRVLRA